MKKYMLDILMLILMMLFIATALIRMNFWFLLIPLLVFALYYFYSYKTGVILATKVRDFLVNNDLDGAILYLEEALKNCYSRPQFYSTLIYLFNFYFISDKLDSVKKLIAENKKLKKFKELTFNYFLLALDDENYDDTYFYYNSLMTYTDPKYAHQQQNAKGIMGLIKGEEVPSGVIDGTLPVIGRIVTKINNHELNLVKKDSSF